jgi:hypothetical protein
VKRLYTDDDGSFKAAARELKWRHDNSKPHDPQANGLIEVHVGIVQSGARALLFQAGLPALCWPWDVKYFCQMRNIMDRYNRFGTLISSPYFQRYETPNTGLRVPFGAYIEFLTSSRIAAEATPKNGSQNYSRNLHWIL